MSAWWEWALAIFAAICGLNFHLLMREISRLRKQTARLTRRVWILEGRPMGSAIDEPQA